MLQDVVVCPRGPHLIKFVHTVFFKGSSAEMTLICAAGEFQATLITAALVLLFALLITALSALSLLPVAVGWVVCRGG